MLTEMKGGCWIMYWDPVLCCWVAVGLCYIYLVAVNMV